MHIISDLIYAHFLQSATGRIRNVFGGAETFEANIAFGTKTRRSFRASLSAPISRDLDTIAELNTYGLERDLTSFASCFEGLRGVRAVVRARPYPSLHLRLLIRIYAHTDRMDTSNGACTNSHMKVSPDIYHR